jgi:mono/diheme cytochrome c family protein
MNTSHNSNINVVRMKKVSILTVLGLVVVLLFTACSNPASQEIASTQPAVEEIAPADEDVIEAPATEETFEDDPATEEVVVDAPTEEPVASGLSFSNDVLPILQSSCVRCHGSNRADNGLRLDNYEHLMTGSKYGPVVIAGDAQGSLLVELSASGEMPKRGAKLTAEQVKILTDWVSAGANNN